MKKTLIIFSIIVVILILIYFFKFKIKNVVKKFKIRNDGKVIGEGFFGASRSGGKRKHAGIDIEVKETEPIYAPDDLNFLRLAFPYKTGTMEGAEYTMKNGLKLKIFYFKPIKKTFFKKGEVIGYAQSVSGHYKDPRMTDHIHLELRDKNDIVLNPEKFV